MWCKNVEKFSVNTRDPFCKAQCCVGRASMKCSSIVASKGLHLRKCSIAFAGVDNYNCQLLS